MIELKILKKYSENTSKLEKSQLKKVAAAYEIFFKRQEQIWI